MLLFNFEVALLLLFSKISRYQLLVGQSFCCPTTKANYGSRGLIALTEHIGTKTHVGNYVIEKTNYSFLNASSEVVHHPHGIHPDYRNF